MTEKVFGFSKTEEAMIDYALAIDGDILGNVATKAKETILNEATKIIENYMREKNGYTVSVTRAERGKAKTTPKEMSDKEVEALIKEKLKKGYEFANRYQAKALDAIVEATLKDEYVTADQILDMLTDSKDKNIRRKKKLELGRFFRKAGVMVGNINGTHRKFYYVDMYNND